MRRRFTVDEKGDLVDRHGVVLGKVVAITIDVPTPPGPPSTTNVVVSSEVEENPPTPTPQPLFAAPPEEPQEQPVEDVWQTYVRVMNPRRKALDPEERKIIRDALKVATADECKAAIVKCSQSGFHMGQNDRGRKYNSIRQILKGKRGTRTTREQIDFMLSLKGSGDVPSVPRETLHRWMQQMQTRATYPGNALAEQQGAEAEAKLREHGIEATWVEDRVIDGKYPTFPDFA
jgi:hypothetical protein